MKVDNPLIYLEAIRDNLSNRMTRRQVKTLNAAIKHQTPTIPIYEGDGYANGLMVYDMWRCPNCDQLYDVEYDQYNYCPKCGQAIDLRGGKE